MRYMSYTSIVANNIGEYMSKQEVIYITYDQALDLVDRIAQRAENFDYTMSTPEKEAMASLLNDCGVNVDDLIDVSRLADNYAINAEIVRLEDIDNYSRSALQDALFTWKEEGETCYCIQW